MFRNVPGCSMFRVLSTPKKNSVIRHIRAEETKYASINELMCFPLAKKIIWSISGNVIDFGAKCPRTIVKIRESIRTVVFVPS